MKKFCVAFVVATIFCLSALAQKTEEVCYNPNLIKDTTKKSIKSMAYAITNGDSVTIKYHSPGVRKELFGAVWYHTVRCG